MRKRKTIYFIIVLAFITGAMNFSLAGTPIDDEEESIAIDFKAGLNVSFNTTPIKMGPGKVSNSLVYSNFALEVDANVADFLTLGLLAGYSGNHFKNPVDFEELPLSLRFDSEKNNALLLGLTAASEFPIFGDFSLMTRGEFLYFIPFKRESEISLPIVSGNAVSKCSFYQADIEILGQYDGFSLGTFFFGPQLFLAGGKYNASETIAGIKDDETLKFKQKNFLGVVGGINFDLAEHFNIELKATLLSKTTVAARILYLF